MASEKGPIATEAPLITPAVPQTSALPAVVTPEAFAVETNRPKSLKRGRETTPTSPTSAVAGLATADLSPSKIARLVGFASRQSPAPLTGAAALEDERRRREEEQRLHPPSAVSENPGQKVLTDLLSGSAMAMSRPQDAPAASGAPAADGTVKALQAVTIPAANAVAADGKADTSPHSTTSPVSIGSAGAGVHVTHSPAPMDVDSRNDRLYAPQPEAQMEEKTGGSLSYPGILPPGGTMAAPAPPQRSGSLPMPSPPNPELAPRSPSSKKHKCPYCETEFTRHHNLKSHLLTHSQEKPYVCQTCQMRFRRLHDLKRHSKLHTGEKPHICPKCDRKFARGDALARHSKGAGGCAGRRASMGSFAGDEDYEGASTTEADDSMAGVIYDGPAGEAEMTEEERRRLSLPSIKAQHVAGQAPGEGYGPHSHTYPPASQRVGASGGLFPPNVDRGAASSNTSPSMPNSTGSGHTPNTSVSSIPLSGGSSSMYSQSGMTESPKPLSPAAVQTNQAGQEAASLARKRSPSANTQFQQHGQFSHRQTDHHAASGLSLPSHATTAVNNVGQQGARVSAGQGHAPSGSSGSGVDNANNLFASGETGLWAYIQSLEDKVKQLSEKVTSMEGQMAAMERTESAQEHQISYLTGEVATLRQQLETRPEAPATHG